MHLELGKERVTIGRSRDSDVFLPDQWLSRHHAEIRRKDGVFFLADLGSKNGTLLNGERIGADQRLRHGDVITLGEHTLTYAAGEGEEVEDGPEPAGTQVFSALELSQVAARPGVAPDELARQNRVLGILTESTKALLKHRPLPELFELILDLLSQAVPAERFAILLLEGDPPQPLIKASRCRQGEPIAKVSRTITRHVLEERVSLLLPNVMADAAFKGQQSILSTGIRSALCAPLWFTATEDEEDAVIGLVYVDTRDVSRSFDEDDLRILTALANVAAAKIENVRLLEESLEKRRMEQDMQVAAEIQTNLLPRGAPEVAGYGLVGSNRPCRTVGGDYYDFAEEGEGILLALGDVSGKGTGAALLMTVLRASVRAHWSGSDPAESVARINRTVYQNTPTNKYITFFMAQLDPPSGRLAYVNAGHNPPLLVREDGNTETLSVGGMALGLFDDVAYEQGSVSLEPGDSLIVYSDGVTETWNTRDEEFGEEGLEKSAVANRELEAGLLQEEILKELEHFEGGAKATDDRTLVVLKRNPARAAGQ